MRGRAEFAERFPGVFFLDAADAAGIGSYLSEHRWNEPGERVVSAAKAGEGNMNCVLRVETTRRTLILKQARPWVEKYSHIPAPAERALTEGRFYRAVAGHEALSRRMPRLLGLDPEARILLLEDLGAARDFTFVYRNEMVRDEELHELTAYLSSLHRIRLAPEDRRALANRPMRELNHAHIFRIPLSPKESPDLDAVTPGLNDAALALRGHGAYVSAVAELGEIYLADGDTLLHGDYFPGSWLRTAHGVRVIDPEFCFCGAPEFDLGVMCAHAILARPHERGDEALKERYDAPAGFAWSLALRFAGVEIMRRLLGVAQLPLSHGLETKARLLQISKRLVLDADPGDSP